MRETFEALVWRLCQERGVAPGWVFSSMVKVPKLAFLARHFFPRDNIPVKEKDVVAFARYLDLQGKECKYKL